MRLTHLVGVGGGVTLLCATAFAAQQTGQRDRVLTGYRTAPGLRAPAPAPAPAPAVEEVAQRPSRDPDASVDPRWARRTADAAGIPLPAMTAYARASVLAPRECRIGWTTLAGIGWVESQHGTIGDRLLGEDGHSSEPILGPALDGGLYAAVPATRDSVRWHGDRQWDHAIGPMQFIPSTWRTWQVDGDGDGLADPNDIDDASLAAANYLCQSGDLTTAGNWSRAVLGYNHSSDYVLNVYTAADAYAARTG
ncbi:lytic transglycosylase domain-containing protein [Nocardioides sp. B-3]|uniref:lytic transglycosylase domain-containing protein n=1 Tax=Nocardioides sp. B-3 TaxID=2895565 RepID=UPI0021531573|nr:lytic transglycosylase domain-containing protein [Nocardioides sp. B-3]UUZ61567.1 lytic transglycosylase domain-containing protein [Nocardioides sp. B-3]